MAGRLPSRSKRGFSFAPLCAQPATMTASTPAITQRHQGDRLMGQHLARSSAAPGPQGLDALPRTEDAAEDPVVDLVDEHLAVGEPPADSQGRGEALLLPLRGPDVLVGGGV